MTITLNALPCRVGGISFINTIPVYYHLSTQTPQASIRYANPAALNEAMLAGDLEIAPVSSSFYARHTDQFVPLQNLSVSSYGSVESVIFLTQKPLEAGMEITVGVPDDSATSVDMLGFILKHLTGQDQRTRFQRYHAADFEAACQQFDGVLIIGDTALMARYKHPELIASRTLYDLSSLWNQLTGLPFVFALWVANRDWADRRPEQLSQVNSLLVQSKIRFFQDPILMNQGIQLAMEKSGLDEPTIRRYFTQCLSYDFSPEHQQSLKYYQDILRTRDLEQPYPLMDAKTREHRASAEGHFSFA
ncbi:MAG: menaquinone biosynthesis protein [Candidatus Melainabacteria bacterium]